MPEPAVLDSCGVARPRGALDGPPTVEPVLPRRRPHTMDEAGFSCVRKMEQHIYTGRVYNLYNGATDQSKTWDDGKARTKPRKPLFFISRQAMAR
jgi:hypothetical protein